MTREMENTCSLCNGDGLSAEYNDRDRIRPSRAMIRNMFGVKDNTRSVWIGMEDGGRPILWFDNSEGEYACAGVEVAYCPVCGANLMSAGKDGEQK